MSVLQEALARVGIDLKSLAPPDNYVRAAGAVLQGDFIGSTVDSITIYSQYTAPVTYTAADLRRSNAPDADDGQPKSVNPWGVLFKPTVIVNSPLRSRPYVFAPYGMADPEAYKGRQSLVKYGPLLALTLLGGGAFFLGRASKR